MSTEVKGWLYYIGKWKKKGIKCKIELVLIKRVKTRTKIPPTLSKYMYVFAYIVMSRVWKDPHQILLITWDEMGAAGKIISFFCTSLYSLAYYNMCVLLMKVRKRYYQIKFKNYMTCRLKKDSLMGFFRQWTPYQTASFSFYHTLLKYRSIHKISVNIQVF